MGRGRTCFEAAPTTTGYRAWPAFSRRRDACLLQPGHGAVAAAHLAVCHPPAVAVPLGDPVGLRAGSELLGEVPLVRPPLSKSAEVYIIVISQPRLARSCPGVFAVLLPDPGQVGSRVWGVEVLVDNAGACKREDHRAALHRGRFGEEVVALTRRVSEHPPLPAQGVYPFARTAGKAPGGEGHLPVPAGRTLAHLEVET
jgi:hypothetical protein